MRYFFMMNVGYRGLNTYAILAEGVVEGGLLVGRLISMPDDQGAVDLIVARGEMARIAAGDDDAISFLKSANPTKPHI